MNNNDFAKLISKMGSPHHVLVAENLIPATELKHLYEDEDTLELEIAPGIELVFWAETSRLEMIHINYERANVEGKYDLTALLPAPLNKARNENDVHIALGQPMFSKTERDLLQTELYGWDIYQLDNSLHPEAVLDIQYNKFKNICNIQISLMDKNI